MSVKPELSIITVNYNGLKDTCALIETIPLDETNIEVIVVDNASREDEGAIIKSRFPKVNVITSDKNLGFAGGNNLGIKASNGKYIFLINNDTIFKKFDVRYLLERLESSPKIGVVCPLIKFAFGEQKIQFAGYTPLSNITIRNKAFGYGEIDNGQYSTPHSTPYAHGAAMMLKKEVIDKVGLMSEDFFLYYEELDWSMHITRAGYEIWYEPKCTIYHKESQSTGQGSPLRSFYITRNRMLLVKRNFNGMNKYISYIYLIIIVGLRDCIRSVINGQFDIAKATVKGILSFIRK